MAGTKRSFEEMKGDWRTTFEDRKRRQTNERDRAVGVLWTTAERFTVRSISHCTCQGSQPHFLNFWDNNEAPYGQCEGVTSSGRCIVSFAELFKNSATQPPVSQGWQHCEAVIDLFTRNITLAGQELQVNINEADHALVLSKVAVHDNRAAAIHSVLREHQDQHRALLAERQKVEAERARLFEASKKGDIVGSQIDAAVQRKQELDREIHALANVKEFKVKFGRGKTIDSYVLVPGVPTLLPWFSTPVTWGLTPELVATVEEEEQEILVSETGVEIARL